MVTNPASDAQTAGAPPVDGWVRRPWCVWAGVAIVLLGALLNLSYLFNHCPLDLGEDESHYWEWSRHLDYGYYSKPPGVAWVIRGATELARLVGVPNDGVALMPWVRLPALVFGLVSGLMLLALARRVFRDDRAALAVVVLSGAAPMFVVGGLLITIDSPMYMCWVLTLWALWRYVGEGKPVAWLYLAGVFCGVGMLFKPVLIALPLCAMIAAWLNTTIRARLKTWHSLGAMALVLGSQVPVVIWNSRHNWVTFRHIGTQGGLTTGAEKVSTLSRVLGPIMREGIYLGGQAGVLGGALAVFLIIAIAMAWEKRRTGNGSERLRFSFLLSMALPLWLFYAMLSLWTNTEPNWPAASYAAGMVLLAGMVACKWNDTDARVRQAWRWWLGGTVVLGAVIATLAMNAQRFYPLVADMNTSNKSWAHPRQWDLSAKTLRGFAARGQAVGDVLQDFRAATGKEPRVVAARYDMASSLAFYLPGQPQVECIMSRVGGRMNQYDLWHGLCAKCDADCDVLLVGSYDAATIERVIRPAFARIETDAQGRPKFEHLKIEYHGVVIREIDLLRCYGFKGWTVAPGMGRF